MTNLIIFGETMLELSRADDQHYKKSFAGDVHSVALYLKRASSAASSYLLTGIGQDVLSADLLQTLKSQSIETELALPHPKKTLGIYMVNTDEHGERSFDYWRENSAARETLNLIDEVQRQKILALKADAFFFSGISLAILDEASRSKLWALISELKQAGTQIYFDPNYRPKLWRSIDETRAAFEQAFSLSDLILPSLEDMQQLWDAASFEDAAMKLRQFAPDAALVIKDGPAGILYADETEQFHLPVTPVANVVDTTAAGDSFNGSFIAARIAGKSAHDALDFAARVAAEVIQHKGAVITMDAYAAISPL